MSAETFPTGVGLPAAREASFIRRHAEGAILPIGFMVICMYLPMFDYIKHVPTGGN